MTTPTPSAVRPSRPWRGVSPAMAPSLSDSRRQLHHAAQLANAAGISWLPAQADDSHTNLEWVQPLGGVFCGVAPVTQPFRVGIRVEHLALVVADERTARPEAFPPDGQRVTDAAEWLRERAVALGADASRFTLDRHYVIPHHPVGDGAPFDAAPRAALAELAARLYYAEPYFYVNMHPPHTAAEAAGLGLDGKGHWHTDGWLGAVLPASARCRPRRSTLWGVPTKRASRPRAPRLGPLRRRSRLLSHVARGFACLPSWRAPCLGPCDRGRWP